MRVIDRLHFENFKSFRDASIDLGRLTVLLGPNASGKSTVLDGAHYLCQLAGQPQPREELFEHERSLSFLRTQGVSERMMLRASFSFVDERGSLTWSFWRERETPAGGAPVGSEDWRFEQTFAPAGLDQGRLGRLRSVVRLRLDPKELAAPAYSEDVPPRMKYSGSGLAAVLANLKLTDDDRFHTIQERLRAVVGSVRALRVEQAKIQVPVRVSESPSQYFSIEPTSRRWIHEERMGFRLLFDFQGAQGVPAHAASEGTLLVLGILTAMVAPPNPRLVLLDDLDRGLHPLAQKELVVLLKQLLEKNKDLQILATSHSPYLVDHLEPSEVRLTAVSPEGFARIACLTDHPDFERWKGQMAPGEFWSLVGESWATGAAAGHA